MLARARAERGRASRSPGSRRRRPPPPRPGRRMPGPTRGVRPCSSSVRRSPATGRTVSPARPAAGLSVLIPAPWRPEPSAHTPNLERIGLPVVVVDVRPVALVHADVEPVAAGLDVEAVDGERDRPRPGQRAEPNRVALGRQVENARPVGDPVERHPDDRFLDRDVRGSGRFRRAPAPGRWCLPA